MHLEIENIRLADSISVLEKLSLKGLKSIHRTRLTKTLTEKLQRVAEEEKELKKEHSNLDDDGEPIIKDGKYDIKDMDSFNRDIQDFYSEKVIINDDHLQQSLKSVKQSLEESEIEWEGKEAYAYADLYEGFKGDKEDNEE